MEFGWIEIINIIMIFQLLFFSFFLFIKKRDNISNYILGFYLFSQAIVISSYFYYKLLYKGYPHLAYIGFPFAFVWGPTFYLYVKSIAYKDFRLKFKNVIHFIPFLIIFLYFSFTFYFYSEGTKKIILHDPSYLITSKGIWIDIILRLQIFFYIIKSLYILRSVQKSLKENYSSNAAIDIPWLKFIVIGYTSCYILSVFLIYTEQYLNNFISLIHLCVYLSFFIFFNIILFKAWNSPQIFIGVEENLKYKYSRLKKDEAEFWIKKLSDYLSESKVFFNPELTLTQLGEEINLQPKVLSQIINEYFKQNFYDYINQYRIEESKRLLLDPANKKNVMEILYETGFNSKATFNRAFKKETGFTPTEFKKKFAGTNNLSKERIN